MLVIILLLVIVLLLMRIAPKRSRPGESFTFGQNAMVYIVCFVVVLFFALLMFS